MYNLSPATIIFIEQRIGRISVLAGYGQLPQLLFLGDIAPGGVVTERQGADRVTTVEAGDGQADFSQTRFDFHFGPGTPVSLVLATMVAETGLILGTAAPLPPRQYATGVTFFGLLRAALDEVVGAEGRWSIQDGVLEIRLRGQPVPEPAVVLNSLTGLIGSPTRTDDGVNATSLLRPDIRPGRIAQLLSESFTGFVRVARVVHTGDTEGNDWTTEIEGKPL
jgi:hypothetical protein